MGSVQLFNVLVKFYLLSNYLSKTKIQFLLQLQYVSGKNN